MIYNESLYRDSLRTDTVVETSLNEVFKTKFNSSDWYNSYSVYWGAAKPFNLSQVVYEPFVDMGFFEFNGMLWAKGYKMSLKLTENYSIEDRNDAYELQDGVTVKNNR